MIVSKPLDRDLFKYLDIAYFVKFILLVILLYYFDEFYAARLEIGKSTFSPFLYNYLNYPSWIVSTNLHASNLIAHAFGLNSYVDPPIKLKVVGGSGIFMIPACLGLKIMSFWLAFIIAQKNDWRRKILWSLGGVLAIWAINILRIALLLLAVQHKWQVNKYVDHHRLFNWAAYALILLMIYAYYQKSKKKRDCLRPCFPGLVI